jgi:hypothetical protein
MSSSLVAHGTRNVSLSASALESAKAERIMPDLVRVGERRSADMVRVNRCVPRLNEQV